MAKHFFKSKQPDQNFCGRIFLQITSQECRGAMDQKIHSLDHIPVIWVSDWINFRMSKKKKVLCYLKNTSIPQQKSSNITNKGQTFLRQVNRK